MGGVVYLDVLEVFVVDRIDDVVGVDEFDSVVDVDVYYGVVLIVLGRRRYLGSRRRIALIVMGDSV